MMMSDGVMMVMMMMMMMIVPSLSCVALILPYNDNINLLISSLLSLVVLILLRLVLIPL